MTLYVGDASNALNTVVTSVLGTKPVSVHDNTLKVCKYTAI